MNTQQINPVKKARLTKAQNAALRAYWSAVDAEDRFINSVFLTPIGLREYSQRTAEAYAVCKSLGMGEEHGLYIAYR